MQKGKYIIIAPVYSTTVRVLSQRLKMQAAQRDPAFAVSEWSYTPNPGNARMLEHATAVPPFRTSYAVASAINMGLTASELKYQRREEPGLNSTLVVGKLGWFRGQKDVLKLEVRCPLFSRFSSTFREKFSQDPEIEWLTPIPDKVNPHITIGSGEGAFERLNGWVEQWNRSKPKQHAFRVPAFLFLARYKSGWSMLADDPANEN